MSQVLLLERGRVVEHDSPGSETLLELLGDRSCASRAAYRLLTGRVGRAHCFV